MGDLGGCRVAIVDTNYAMLPSIKGLKTRGAHVTILGNFCSREVAINSDETITVDYSDHRALSLVLDKNRFDAVVPGCTDASYLSCANLGVEGCESVEVTGRLHNKRLFCESARGAGVKTPREYSSIREAFAAETDILVKPDDSFSGQGIGIFESGGGLHHLRSKIDYARYFSSSSEVLLQEYLRGDLYSFSAFWNGYELVDQYLVRELCVANPFVVDRSFAVEDDLLYQSARSDALSICRSLALQPGLVHFQMILLEGEWYFLECMRRLPGDLYSQLIDLAFQTDYSGGYLRPFLREEVSSLSSTQSAPDTSLLRITVAGSSAIQNLKKRFKEIGIPHQSINNGMTGERNRETFFFTESGFEVSMDFLLINSNRQ
jgi:hypothetical protein